MPARARRLKRARTVLLSGRVNALVAYVLDLPEADIDKVAAPSPLRRDDYARLAPASNAFLPKL